MKFQRYTTVNKSNSLIKIIIICIVLFVVALLIDRIDFPSPNKKIEKIVPNENLRIIK